MNRRLDGLNYERRKHVARPKSWAVAIAVYVAVFTTCAFADHGQSEALGSQSPGYVPEPGALTLFYDVEAVGIPAVTARFDISYRADRYDMSFVLRTTGLIDLIVNWNMSMNAQGILKNIAVVPEQYHEVRPARALEIVYAAGKIVSAPKKPPSKTDQRPEIAEAGRSDAADLLSLTLAALLSINAGPGCNYRGILYDGARLFDLVVTLEAGSQAISGPIRGFAPSLVCDFVWHRHAPQTEQKDPNRVIYDHDPQVYRLWLARISADGPMVPVKLVFDLDIGVVEATLNKSRIQFSRTQAP